MPVLAPLKAFFEGLVSTSDPQPERPIPEARAAMHTMIESSFNALAAQHPPLPFERDYSIAVAGGNITVRVYAPAPARPPLPCHLYFHGGGFWLGTLDQSDSMCRALASAAGCVVVSVDYRLAPEHKFPTAPEDCYEALLWLASHAGELGVDPARISVGGGSAGGNLAAVVSLMTRDRGAPSLVLQVLEIPVLDFTHLEPLRIPEEDVVVPSGKEEYRSYYLANTDDATSPYASPLLAHDLTRLPPALIMYAQYDPLRPEAEAYARRLAEAGVPVEERCWEGQFHGSQRLDALIPDEAAAYQAQIVQALQRAYGSGD